MLKTADALVDLLDGFSHKRAVRWLQEKFDAYDSEAGVAELKAVGPTLNKTDREYFAEMLPMGFIKGLPTKDGLRKPLVVASVKMARDMTERTSRAKQFALAKNIIATAFANPDCCRSAMGRGLGLCTAGLFFFHDTSGNFRISLVTCSLKGRKLVAATAKRQSFFCRVNAKNNIAKRQLEPDIKTFEDLEKAFSVEAVTKEFYKKLFTWYEWACDQKTGVTFPNKIHDPNDDREKLPEAIIRLITRLMFVWFVRQKGLIPDDLFDRAKVSGLLKDFSPNAKNEGTYYRAILQNLFFATLNCPEDKRRFAHLTNTRGDKKDWAASDHGCPTIYRYKECFTDVKRFEELMRQIPFLNCALFDCLDKRFDRREDADEIARNGGETEIYLDGFSRDKKHQAFVPNALFFYDKTNNAGHEGIIALFDQYEFTVDENTADDADVALDPELLGKVFENLLGAFNPETKEVARNATGSFYTPREIVDYMTDESLKNYLKTKVAALTDEQLKRLFDRNDETDAHAYLKGETVDAILAALYSIKILDPACGSGAFPMGLLHRITRLFDKLDNNCTSVRKEIRRRYEMDKSFVTTAEWMTEKERAERLADIEEQYKTNLHHPDYTRKLFVIENCIYGVDIQPIATQISKLRFFISLLCDQLRRRRAEGGARQDPLLALPNLEAKFVCANTLIALPKLGGELNLTPEITKLREKLAKQRRRYFFARTYATKKKAQADERQIRREIKAAVKHVLCTPDEQEIAKQTAIITGLEREHEKIREPKWIEQKKPRQGDLFGEGLEQGELELVRVDIHAKRRSEIEDAIEKARAIIAKERAKATQAQTGSAADDYAEQVANWDPYDQNYSSPFFDPDWMFGIKDGFDIVIGNPPYVQLQANGGELAKMYQNKGFETFAKTGDLYCLFYEQGFRLTSSSGMLCYITSNKWMRAGYGLALRKFLAEKTNPGLLIDFAGEKIFESASVDTNILILGHGANEGNTISCVVGSNLEKSLSDFVRSNSGTMSYLTADIWLVVSPLVKSIEAKIRRIGTPLVELGVQINYGIKTGFNDAFIVDEETRQRILSNAKSKLERAQTNDLLKPLLRGRNIKFKQYNWNGEYLIAIHNGVPERGIPRIDVRDYPAVKKHLDKYYAKLVEREDQGDTPYNLRACAYIEDFNKPKLIYPETTQGAYFALDDGTMWLDKTCFMIVSERAEYLQRILSCKLFEFAYRTIFASVGLGKNGYQYNKHALLKLPIPEFSVANEIMAVNTDCEIDQFVYKLYGLTEEEIAIVEGRDAQSASDKTRTMEGTAKRKGGKAQAAVEAAEAAEADDDYEVLD